MLESKAESLYNNLLKTREIYEPMWYECAQHTLPFIYTGVDANEQSGNGISVPYNSVGASSVNNLSSKLSLNLFPPTKSFFKIIPDSEQYKELSEEQRRELDKAVTNLSIEISQKIEEENIRTPLIESLKSLIITGNSLVYKTDSELKVFNVYEYVVERDFSNNILNIVIKENISRYSLSEELLNEVEKDETSVDEKEENFILYTLIKRTGQNEYTINQEINGIEFNEEKYTKDTLPYLVLRFNTSNNSWYGIGLVEQYLGDFQNIARLSKSISKGAELMSKVVFGRVPGVGKTSVNDLEKAFKKGDGNVIYGDLNRDLSILRIDKSGDFNVAYQVLQNLETKISKAFLNMNVRDSERTTATEIRANALELESALGGTYGVLTSELQLPILKLLLNDINPKALKSLSLSITSGLNSISKEKEYQNLQTYTTSIVQFGQEVISQYLDIPAYFDEIAKTLGIDGSKILKSNEQIQAEQQQKQEALYAQQQQQVEQEINNKAENIKNK